jgi:hypothetical protein
MSLSTLPDRAETKSRRVLHSIDPRDADFRLPLRAELFLLAHDDATGREHLDRRALCLGLAGAILLELWLEQRILIGRRYLVRDGRYTRDPGRITILDHERYGDPLTDAAITLLRRTGGPLYVTDFIRQFATPDLYDRVRGDMLAAGVLRRVPYRRFRFFWERDRYLAIRPEWVVRARAKVRNLPRNGNEPQTVALGSLVAALGLTRNLFHAEPVRLHGKVMDLIRRFYDSTPWDVQAAVNPANPRYAR